ncbi:MAG: hypothetical protein WA399_06155 [Acidobacteriaceae bacterium]
MNNGSSTASVAVLTSWKEIARYMGKGVRTVQRWEQDFGLPVRRPVGSSKTAILARPGDLDAWVAFRCSSRAQMVVVPNRASSSLGLNKPPVSLGVLSALSAEIHTSRMLRSSNRELMGGIRVALDRLNQELASMFPVS